MWELLYRPHLSHCELCCHAIVVAPSNNSIPNNATQQDGGECWFWAYSIYSTYWAEGCFALQHPLASMSNQATNTSHTVHKAGWKKRIRITCALCQDLASLSWHYSLQPGITSLALSSTSWTSIATGDSGSHRHAALWALFAACPEGARGLALLYSRDQSGLLCQRDKALLCSKHPALFLLLLFFLFFQLFLRWSRCSLQHTGE